jgi:hypothetical protein
MKIKLKGPEHSYDGLYPISDQFGFLNNLNNMANDLGQPIFADPGPSQPDPIKGSISHFPGSMKIVYPRVGAFPGTWKFSPKQPTLTIGPFK